MTLDRETYDRLLISAVEYNMSIQKLLRHIIVPDWLKREDKK